MENYALMRHSDYILGTDKLTKEGVLNTRKMAQKIKDFVIRNNFKEIVIYHSFSKRVEKTAFLLKIEMKYLVTECITELFFLREGSISISEKKITELTKKKDIFYIFLTHKPNITLFLAKKGIVKKVPHLFFWTNNKILEP